MNHIFSLKLTTLSIVVIVSLLAAVSVNAGQYNAGDWPLYSRDFNNSNHNPDEVKLNEITAPFLKRSWETFNDDAQVSELAPAGFVLESVLGLQYPSAVVGVVGSPIVIDGTAYYVDQLGTLFARDVKTGQVSDPVKHWTTTLVDPVFEAGSPALLPSLFFTAPVVTDDYIFLASVSSGLIHAVERRGGAEVDFDNSTPEVNPYMLFPGFNLASVLGDPVIINTGPNAGNRDLYIVNANVILNDALLGDGEVGTMLALDITDPLNPVEVFSRAAVDVDSVTGQRLGTGSSMYSFAVDFERNLLIGGTGQQTTEPYPGYPGPDLAPEGFVDRSDSMYAINYLTGEFEWTNQFHQGDVFDLNNPVSTGPNNTNPFGAVDADLLSPPVLWTATLDGERTDLAGVGSKGGLYRVVNRENGETVWERQISQQTGIGGVQAGSAYANDVVYVVGFEGIDEGFSDAQFGVSFDTGINGNAFFATFNPSFWADVEDVRDDDDASTGVRSKVYKLDAATGESLWNFDNGNDFVELLAGATLRHLTVANGLVYVTTSSGQLIILSSQGEVLYTDQTPDLNAAFGLGLGKPHHASMNAGAVVSDGNVIVGYGAQNNPSGGVFAYQIDSLPASNALIDDLLQRVLAFDTSGRGNRYKNRIASRLRVAQRLLSINRVDRAISRLISINSISIEAFDAGVFDQQFDLDLRKDILITIEILQDGR